MNNSMKKSKPSLNFIDVIIIAAVIAVIAFAVWLFFGEIIKKNVFGIDAGSDCYVRYTISMNQVDDRYIESITENNEIFRGDDSLGVIEKVEISEVERIEMNERTSELVVSDYPDYKKVVLTVAAKAKLEGDTVKIGKLKIVVGSYVEFKYPGFKSYGYITSFEKLSEMPEILGKAQPENAAAYSEA